MLFVLETIILLVCLIIGKSFCGIPPFSNVMLIGDSNVLKKSVAFTMNFTVTENIIAGSKITFYLPRMYGPSFSSMLVAPSSLFDAEWSSGTMAATRPFEDSKIILSVLPGIEVVAGSSISLYFDKYNGLKSFCGSPSSVIYYNSSYLSKYMLSYSRLTSPSVPFVSYEWTNGTRSSNLTLSYFSGFDEDFCLNILKNCSSHGICDYCQRKCICDEGYGRSSDVTVIGRGVSDICSSRMCFLAMINIMI